MRRCTFRPFSNRRDMYRSLIVVGAMFLTACAAGDAGLESTRIEGRTAAVSNGATLYALRLWTAPELDSLQRAGVRIDSIAVTPGELRMRRGDRVPLSNLSVIALDSAGQPVPAAPIVLEIDSTIVVLTPMDVVARRRGRSSVRIRSLLPTSSGGEAEQAIRVRVE